MCKHEKKSPDGIILAVMVLFIIVVQFGFIAHFSAKYSEARSFIGDGLGRMYVTWELDKPEWVKPEMVFEFLASFYCMHPEQLKKIKLLRGCKMTLGFQTEADEKKVDSWRNFERFQ